MKPYRRSVSLPLSFGIRYVLGQVLVYLPVMTAIGVFAWALNSRWFPYIVAKYVLGAALVAWLAVRRSQDERMQLERFAAEDPDFARRHGFSKAVSQLLPAGLSGLLAGSILSAMHYDARWMIVAGGLGVLIAAGIGMRWLVFDRWLERELRRLELLRWRTG